MPALQPRPCRDEAPDKAIASFTTRLRATEYAGYLGEHNTPFNGRTFFVNERTTSV